MKNTFVCVVCPNGCEVTAEGCGDDISFSGAFCPKGKDYARQETVDPRRTIASLVRVTGSDRETVCARLTRPVPLARIKDIMGEIEKLSLAAPVTRNEVIVANILGLESDLVATDDAAAKETV